MHRRTVLASAVSLSALARSALARPALARSALARPALARGADRLETLRFVPTPDLTSLDPMVVGNRATHTHAFLVFDTLFGVDADYRPRPQMIGQYGTEAEGRVWRLRLRPGLLFHDGQPVLARDVVASIRRWATRDGFGQALMAATDELLAIDDLSLAFRLKRPFPQLPNALAGSTRTVPCIMPERLAQTDPFRPVTEMIGSGPYRFRADEFDPGAHAAYTRFSDYLPRPGESLSHTAGAKLALIERVEWASITDPATATAALLRGEVDWLEWPGADHLTMLRRAPGIRVEVTEPTGSIGIMRLNHRHAPFDNPAVRRVVAGVIKQAAFMVAVAGQDERMWSDGVGLFGSGHPLASRVGTEALGRFPHSGLAKQALQDAGYRGEPVTVLVVAGNSMIPLLSQIGAAQLREAGMTVDEQVMDIGTMLRRVQNQNPPAKGGWNVSFSILDGVANLTPVAHDFLRGDPNTGAPGWVASPELEALRMSFLQADSLEEQRPIVAAMQAELFQTVPYVPLGWWLHPTAFRAGLAGFTQGFPIFCSVRRI